MLLYIHGFRSTPRSPTARLLKRYFGDAILIADHPQAPDAAVAALETLITTRGVTGLIASSLGGFYATYLSERHALPAALINPSVHPYTTTRRYLGPNTTHDGVAFVWTRDHLEQLRHYTVPSPHASRYFLLLQTGDTVLDYRIAQAHYGGARLSLEEGGSHRFEGLERHLDALRDFFALTSS